MSQSWTELLKPTTDQLRLRAKMGVRSIYDPDAAKSLAEVIETMATKLDLAVETMQQLYDRVEEAEKLAQRSLWDRWFGW